MTTVSAAKTRSAMTQEQLEEKYEPPEFRLSERYAWMMKTFGLGFMFSSVFPLSLVLAFVTLLITLVIDRVRLLRYCRRPVLYDSTMALRAIDTLKVFWAANIVLSIYMFERHNPQNMFSSLSSYNRGGGGAYLPCLISLALFAAYVILPFGMLANRCASAKVAPNISSDYLDNHGIQVYCAPAPSSMLPEVAQAAGGPRLTGHCTLEAYVRNRYVLRWDKQQGQASLTLEHITESSPAAVATAATAAPTDTQLRQQLPMQ